MSGTLDGARIGVALTGSFCTFQKVFNAIPGLIAQGAELYPILSLNAQSLDTRFFRTSEVMAHMEALCGRKCWLSIQDVEPIGPKKLLDLLLIIPCTGNTIAKMANGIADTPVTMAVKSQLRNERPVLIALSTNDGLSTNAQNIGILMNRKHIYFVPYLQDDPHGKPSSLVFDDTALLESVEMALNDRQLQPVLRSTG